MAASETVQQNRELGPLQAEYQRIRGWNLTFIALIFLGGIIGLFAGLYMQAGDMGGGLCVSAFGLLFLLLGAWSIYVAVRDRDMNVRVYDDGLVETRGGTERVIPWEAIAGVNPTMVRSRMRTTYLCTLELKDGHRMQYNDATLQNVSSLCRAIEDETLAPILQSAIEKLRVGQPVSFGKITATREGLSNGQNIVPWDEIEDIELAERWIRVQEDDRWRNFAMAARVRNAHVLTALVKRVNTTHASDNGVGSY